TFNQSLSFQEESCPPMYLHHTWMLELLNTGSILTNNLFWGDEEKCENCTGDHEYQKTDIGTIIDRVIANGLPVLCDGNDGADDGAHVEDSPKKTDVASLLTLCRIRLINRRSVT